MGPLGGKTPDLDQCDSTYSETEMVLKTDLLGVVEIRGKSGVFPLGKFSFVKERTFDLGLEEKGFCHRNFSYSHANSSGERGQPAL